MGREIVGLSSMATRQVLADLAADISHSQGIRVRFTSAGGVDVARQVRAGAPADLVVLADAAIAQLDAEGRLVPGSLRELFVSEVVAAVPRDRLPASIATERKLRDALLSADRIAYSTGPSGTALLDLVEGWGLTVELAPRLVQAPPGVPVGALLARGDADLGFQQHSELMDVPGVVVVGPLPGAAAIRSTFTGGVLVGSGRPALADRVLGLLGSEAAAATAEARGMTLAGSREGRT
jgi:molybdate transport system substrate-binding protein